VGGGCNAIEIREIVLHFVAFRCRGGGRDGGFGGGFGGRFGGLAGVGGGIVFNVPQHIALNILKAGEAIVVLFDDGGVDVFFAIRRGGGFGHGLAGFRKLGALQDEHGGTEEVLRRGFGVIEDDEEDFEGAVAEVVEVVAAGEDEFSAGVVQGGGEILASFHPAIDGDAIYVVGLGGVGKGGTGG
jgi:hypothetical protein